MMKMKNLKGLALVSFSQIDIVFFSNCNFAFVGSSEFNGRKKGGLHFSITEGLNFVYTLQIKGNGST